MNMEEIVTLSVKHNVSDLHLCNAWPARWRRQGRMEIAPFIAPDVDFYLIGLMTRNNISGERMASLISPFHWTVRGACAPVRSHISRERRWRYGFCPSVVLIWRKSRRHR